MLGRPEHGSDYLKAAEAAGLRWADIADWSQERLEKVLLPGQPAARARLRLPLPDFAAVHAELQTHKHLTLQRDPTRRNRAYGSTSGPWRVEAA